MSEVPTLGDGSLMLKELEPHRNSGLDSTGTLAMSAIELGKPDEHLAVGTLHLTAEPPTPRAGPYEFFDEEMVVRALKDIPAFAGLRGRTYTIRKEDVISLPWSIAWTLVHKGMAAEVQTLSSAMVHGLTAASEDKRLQVEERGRYIDASPPPILIETLPTQLDEAAPGVEARPADGLGIIVTGHTGMRCSSEDPPTNPLISEAEGINRLLKTAREQGEDAAIAAMRADAAPRVEAQKRKQEEQQCSDDELLRSGEWKAVLMEALGEDIAGDEYLKEICILSAAQTGLKKRDDQAMLHIFIPGDSQVGKSWMFRNAGRVLLPSEDFLSFTTISGKGLNYLADESKDPRFFEGKVLFVDELAQQNQDARAALKVIMSIGQDAVSNLTVDDKKKSRRQSFTAMPTVWSCSAEAIEDAERQLLNRPLIAAVDESPGQTGRIHAMQKDKAAFGTFYALVSRKADALRVMNRIREARDAEVLVLFSDYYRPDDEHARGMIPQFDALISAVAYCNRFARPTVTASDGHQVIFATFEDGIEATRLWGRFIKHKETHLAQRYLDVLDALDELPKRRGQVTLNIDDVESMGKIPEDLKEELNTKLGKGWAIGYVRNMLTDLRKEGLAEYHECPDGKNRWVALMHPSHSSHFVTYENVTDGGEKLARRISEIKRRISRNHTKLSEELPEDLFELILPPSKVPPRSAKIGSEGREASVERGH